MLLLCSAVFLFVLLLYMHLETRWLAIHEITLQSKVLPQEFHGIRVAFISDIHHGPYFSYQRVQNLVEKIKQLDPDLILLGGDYVHRDVAYIEPVFSALSKLKATHGVYAVLGNHDHWEDAELSRNAALRAGIHIVDNTGFWISRGADSIRVCGVGDLWEDKQLLREAITGVQPHHYTIMVSHNPDYAEIADKSAIDLMLSGHTHGGQVTAFGMWAPLLPSGYGQKYRYGLIHNGSMMHYITSGIGTVTPPLRFFCRPEIVVFTLQHTKDMVKNQLEK